MFRRSSGELELEKALENIRYAIYHKDENADNNKEFADYVYKLKDLDGLDIRDEKTGWTLLMCAFNQQKYGFAVTLLKAGAKPHLASTKHLPGFTLVHECIKYRAISQFRLLTWFDSNFGAIEDYGPSKQTAAERVLQWDFTSHYPGKKRVKDLWADSKKASAEIQKLSDEAFRVEDNAKRAEYYGLMCDILFHQYKIERDLNISKYSLCQIPGTLVYEQEREKNEKCRLAAMIFYLRESQAMAQGAENFYSKIDKPSNPIINLRLNNLCRLIELDQMLAVALCQPDPKHTPLYMKYKPIVSGLQLNIANASQETQESLHFVYLGMSGEKAQGHRRRSSRKGNINGYYDHCVSGEEATLLAHQYFPLRDERDFPRTPPRPRRRPAPLPSDASRH